MKTTEYLLLASGGRYKYKPLMFNYTIVWADDGQLTVRDLECQIAGAIYFDDKSTALQAIDEIGQKKIIDDLFERD